MCRIIVPSPLSWDSDFQMARNFSFLISHWPEPFIIIPVVHGSHPAREFHVSRRARDRYRFDEALFTLTGNVIFADFRAARDFAHRMNEARDLANHPDRAVSAGQLNALGLVDELTHLMVARYRARTNPQLLENASGPPRGGVGPTRPWTRCCLPSPPTSLRSPCIEAT